MTARRPDSARVRVLFAAVSLAWGSSFLFIKVAGTGLSAAQVMVGRLVLGATLLVAIMTVTRRQWPRGRRIWGPLVLVSTFLCVIPFTLYAWAGQHIPSGLSSIYNATTPIATLLVSLALLPDERLTRTRTAGLLVAAAGVVLIAAPWNITVDDHDSTTLLLAQLACLSANLCYAIAYVLTRRLLRAGTYDATTIAASQVTLAAILGLAISPLIGGLDAVHLNVPVVASMLALGLIGTGVVYIWHATIISAWGATVGSTVTYVTPVVGVILGILVLDETLHWNEPTGGVLVLAGVLISQGLLTRNRARV